MKKILLSLLKSLIIASLWAFGALVIFAIIIAAVLNSTPYANILIFFIVGAIYIPFWYHGREGKRIEPYTARGEDVTYRSELVAYWQKEGKILFVIFIVCAVIGEISFFLPMQQNFVAFCLVPIFPPLGLIPIPVLRGVCSIAWAAAVAVGCVLLRSRKLIKELSADQHR